jgi:phage-related minor tail protein
MKTININNKSEISGEGNLHSAHCKPIICIDTGAVYTSVTDAANAVGCSISNMINHLKGKLKTCKGKHFCYLSEATENLNAIVSQIRNIQALKEKAAAWDALQAEQDAIRKAEEKRLADIAKAEEKVNRLRDNLNKCREKYSEASSLYEDALEELTALRNDENTAA